MSAIHSMRLPFKNMSPWLVLLVVALVPLVGGCLVSRAGYESAPYKVVRADGKFEVRDYPAITVVETPMKSPGQDADNGFGRLFQYISGGNAARQKISMTTPVLMTGSGTNSTMAFVMPAKLAPGEVPKPADGSLTVRELPAGRFAVLRYSGGRNHRQETNQLARLEGWMAAQSLPVLSPPIYGYFDPPWTPTFLRRNEVMLRTAN